MPSNIATTLIEQNFNKIGIANRNEVMLDNFDTPLL